MVPSDASLSSMSSSPLMSLLPSTSMLSSSSMLSLPAMSSSSSMSSSSGADSADLARRELNPCNTEIPPSSEGEDGHSNGRIEAIRAWGLMIVSISASAPPVGGRVAWCYPSNGCDLACHFGSHEEGAAAYVATVWGGISAVQSRLEGEPFRFRSRGRGGFTVVCMSCMVFRR